MTPDVPVIVIIEPFPALQTGGTPGHGTGGEAPRSPDGVGAAPAGQQAKKNDQTLIYDRNGLSVHWLLQGGLNAVAEQNLFWNLASYFAPGVDFNSNEDWLEGYVKPGISFEQSHGNNSTFYGKISAVGSYTWGTDAFDARNSGAVTLEEAYLGFRTERSEGDMDISLGPRELQLGDGMLIANGGTSGFERGALKFGPRKAWKRAAIGRVSGQGQTGTAFYIRPNELPSNNGHNELAGVDVRYDSRSRNFVGVTYINVLKSRSPYIKAAPGGIGTPTIIQDGRDKTNALNLYFKASPARGAFRNWFVTGDLAYEWNNRIDMSAWAGRVQVGHNFVGTAWSPSLIYTFKTFSGDDPTTAMLERFDPLYYEGSPGAWATGSKSSMVFINSNVQAHELSLAVQPSKKDNVTLRYAHIRANELASPIQFGQATRFVTTPSGFNLLITGVTNHHLADDMFIEYSRVLNRNTFLTAGFSVSFPGKGIRELAPGPTPNWTGGFVNVVVNF